MGIITSANNWTILFGGNISLSQATGLSSNILSCGQFIFKCFKLQCYSYLKPFLLLGMGFLFKLLVQLIYNTEIHDPYQQFVWDTYLFMLPLVAGLVIQFIFPHSVKFFMKILLYISLIVIPYTIFTHMNFYLDLYVYGLFTLKVKLSNI